jgi:hypothetical protein
MRNIPTNQGASTNEDVVIVYRANDLWLLEDSPIKTRLDESSPAGTTNNLAIRLLVFLLLVRALQQGRSVDGGSGLVSLVF